MIGFLRGRLIVIAGALFFAGCFEQPRELRIYAWVDNVAPELIEAFEKAYKCTVKVSGFDSNEEAVAELMNGACDEVDLFIPSSYVVNQLVRERLIVPIDHTRCPSVKRNLDMRYRATIPEDPDLCYGVPYAISATAFLYATNRVPAGVDVASWSVLDESAFKGHISLLDDMREVMGAALIKLGYSVNATNETEICAAAEQVRTWMKGVHHLDSEDYRFEVPAGVIWLAQGFSPEVLGVIIGDADLLPHPDLAMVYPKEGFVCSCEEFVIPSSCQNLDLAYAFIEFLYANVDATLKSMAYTFAITPSVPALAALAPGFRKMIDLPADLPEKGQALCGFDEQPAVQALYDRLWREILQER